VKFQIQKFDARQNIQGDGIAKAKNLRMEKKKSPSGVHINARWCGASTSGGGGGGVKVSVLLKKGQSTEIRRGNELRGKTKKKEVSRDTQALLKTSN